MSKSNDFPESYEGKDTYEITTLSQLLKSNKSKTIIKAICSGWVKFDGDTPNLTRIKNAYPGVKPDAIQELYRIYKNDVDREYAGAGDGNYYVLSIGRLSRGLV